MRLDLLEGGGASLCRDGGERRGDATAQCSRGVETVVDSLAEDHPRSIRGGRVEKTKGGDVVGVVGMGRSVPALGLL